MELGARREDGHRLMIFGSWQNVKIKAVAVATIPDHLGGMVLPGPASTGPVPDPVAVLAEFRRELHNCLTRRADALFELAYAVLCADGPVRSLPALSLVAEPSWAWRVVRRLGRWTGRCPAATHRADVCAATARGSATHRPNKALLGRVPFPS